MKKLGVLLLLMSISFSYAQSAEEIVTNYLETVGIENAKNVKGYKNIGKASFGPQVFEFENYIIEDGRSLTLVDIQGIKASFDVFDGEVAWQTNMQSLKPEKSDAETTAMAKQDAVNFLSPFTNYSEKGYTIEKLEDETKEGVDCFKIKLTKKPVTVDGVEVENVEFYYFDKETFVPIVLESKSLTGPTKGTTSETIFSDYQEVDGVYMPFSMENKFGEFSQVITIEKVEVLTEIDDSLFKFSKE